jgi:hypothetical protein
MSVTIYLHPFVLSVACEACRVEGSSARRGISRRVERREIDSVPASVREWLPPSPFVLSVERTALRVEGPTNSETPIASRSSQPGNPFVLSVGCRDIQSRRTRALKET